MNLRTLSSIILITVFCSCNVLGKKIKVIPLAPGDIASAENIALKKGDELVLWSKIEAQYDDERPNFSIRYLLEKDGAIVSFDSVRVMDGAHTVNSSFTNEKGGYKTLNAEIENKKIAIKDDGNYTNISAFYFPLCFTKLLYFFSKCFFNFILKIRSIERFVKHVINDVVYQQHSDCSQPKEGKYIFLKKTKQALREIEEAF